MSVKQETSGISKVTLAGTAGAGGLGASINRSTIFTSTRVTVYENRKNSDGTPFVTREIIRYSDAKGSDPVVIATGNNTAGGSRLSFTASATKEERRSAIELGNSSRTQMGSVEKNLDLTSEEKDALNDVGAGINRNDNPETTIETSTSLDDDFKNLVIKDKARKSFGNLIYPLDIGSQSQDILRINMLEYKVRKREGIRINDRRDPFNENDNKIIGTVTLPVPGGISDKNACRWGESSGNVFQLAAANVLSKTIGGSPIKDDINKATTQLSESSPGISAALASAFASNATGVQGLFTRTTGAIINPNLELLFQQPTLRPFQFQFSLSPRNEPESEMITKIIRFFKQGSAPIRSTERLFLKSPHTFKLEYIYRGEGTNHRFLNRFKECALTSIDVNYTPNGTYSTYENGSMSSYQITLAFQELEPVFNSDYAQLDANSTTIPLSTQGDEGGIGF